MRMGIVLLMMAASVTMGMAGDIIVQNVRGDVRVRHGVGEEWKTVSVGDVLKRDDTMMTGKKSSAVLAFQGSDAVRTKSITLPGEVIVDISDIRELSQEELMLKLTMEKVRSTSYEWKNKELNIPNAAVTHGEDRAATPSMLEGDIHAGILQLNGTRVLYDNGFFPTSALRTMDVLRRYPSLADRFESRIMIAQALEKANLRGEALNAYVNLSSAENLNPQQRETLGRKISQLRQQLGN